MAGVDDVAVSTQSKNKEGAYLLCKYLTDKEAGVQLCLGDAVCGARPDLVDDKRINAKYHTKDDVAFFKIIRDKTAKAMQFIYPANLRGMETHQYNTNALAPLWLGKEQPTKAFFDKVNAGLQEMLDRPIP
jgi:ABC-type glycerol-3-phosphate transport system substrate-binding protein